MADPRTDLRLLQYATVNPDVSRIAKAGADEALRLAAQTLEKRRVKVPAADGAGLKPNDSGEES